MASLGWAEACPKSVTGSRVNLVPAWDFQARAYRANHDAGFGSTQPKESMMRFYNHVHSFYCGVDLHARTLALCSRSAAAKCDDQTVDGLTADPSIGVWCRRANGRTRLHLNFPDAEVQKRQSASEQPSCNGNPAPLAVRPIDFLGHIGVRRMPHGTVMA